MKIKKGEKNKKQELRTLALSQIFILVIATIAFSWMIGSSIETVSAADSEINTNSNAPLCGSEGYSFQSCTSASECETVNWTARCLTAGQVCCAVKSTNKIDFGEIFNTGINVISKGNAALELLANGPDMAKKAVANGKKVARLFGLGEKSGTVAGKELVKSTISNSELLGLDPASAAEYAKAMAENDAYLNTIKPIHEGFFSGNPSTFSGVFGQFIMNAAAAAATALIIQYFAKKFASTRNFNDIKLITWLSVAPAAGIGLIQMGSLGVAVGMGIAAGVVALVFGLYMLVGYQKYARDIYTYRVSMWQPPIGGNDCNKCNSLTVGSGENKVSGCSEYICHTYGAACIWFNNNTDYEVCAAGNPNDGAAPVINPAREIYGEEVFPNNQYDYRYSSSAARIVYNGEGGGSGKCVPPYTPIKIALTTHEEAYCKISLDNKTGTPKEVFESMLPMSEGAVYTKNHTVNLPSSVTASEEALNMAGYSINNDGIYTFYVRCSDFWGNINSVDYSVQFCVQKGPDRTPPQIIETNPPSDSFIKADTQSIEDFQVYTDEPVDCKWDTKRVSYNYMNYNFSRCSQGVDDYIAGFDYGCRTNLTQFKDGQENRYYIACRDKPEFKGNATKEAQRNTGTPYEVILKGTTKLIIQNVRINGKQNGTIIKGAGTSSTIKIDVLTSGGAEDGKSKCAYSINTNSEEDYSLFFNEGSLDYLTTNTEELYMPSGFYNLNIKCFDLAENIAETMVNFSVETDNLAPVVVRVYKDESANSLKMITDDIAECVYSTTSCTYDIGEGASIDSENGKEHYIEWDPSRDLYVKCSDEYGNYPHEGTCSIIVRPFEIAEII